MSLFKPSNPFTLPVLEENEIVFPASLVKTACTLAAYYIAAREQTDTERASSIDQDIGAFLSEEFDNRENQAVFRLRFMTLVADCNASFGALNHWHSRWAYEDERI
ncbi:hypothetical protein ALQ08_02416 [Pseudomonas syringae pv. delphinii]|uniref:Uncharacterized protein n=1 Tax=Pseudomonas syringae pv. delphinii TaxID=192088 RepID=A0A0P9PYL2_9PSED|nr:hypothetical protein [Pseudomonas syringae group genomosp. 3]KPX19570.1 hypothetical protein ALO72_200170 [Pseudomonas syringae pv. delphinii]RMP11865.1 hypothetical protein ALQ28_102910 [Pseudomonas syringae pv. delphinii]RMP24390.1 hypothetical protein ALQ27_200099 [Pseudomonas syringae pv. delphinii]RMQ24699.1 hypothetical protein ALQ08_02416 [Pseudomonas syringae pv. delphinii]